MVKHYELTMGRNGTVLKLPSDCIWPIPGPLGGVQVGRETLETETLINPEPIGHCPLQFYGEEKLVIPAAEMGCCNLQNWPA